MFGSGLAYGFKQEVLAPLLGGGFGGVQVAITNLADASGLTGTPYVPSVWATNGELINTITGAGSLIAVAHSAVAPGSKLASHPRSRVAVLAYGIVTLAGGWLIPALVRFLSGTGLFRAGGRRGRYAYLPSLPAPLRADQAAGSRSDTYGSGFTSQANQRVLRRLFTAQ